MTVYSDKLLKGAEDCALQPGARNPAFKSSTGCRNITVAKFGERYNVSWLYGTLICGESVAVPPFSNRTPQAEVRPGVAACAYQKGIIMCMYLHEAVRQTNAIHL